MDNQNLIALFGVLVTIAVAFVAGQRMNRQEDKTDSAADREKLWTKVNALDEKFNSFKTYAAGNYVQQAKFSQELKDLKTEIKEDFKEQEGRQKQLFDEMKSYISQLFKNKEA